MQTETNTKEVDGVARHCAYCLNLCGSRAKLCGGCKKRAYCSKECQIKDWSRKGDGQRHVNWCRRHECGEEDVDWEVVPIPNKGLGIRAKKLLPAGMKIIVEPTFSSPNDHPGIRDLSPEGGTLQLKFGKNIFLGEFVRRIDSQPTVALRIARVNHACQPNAATFYDETALVAILFTQKDIQPGEEITICYYSPFFWLIPDELMLSLEEELYSYKHNIASKHGITCSPDCFCCDPTVLALVKEGRQLYATSKTLVCQNKVEEALAAGEKLLDIYRRLNVSWEYLGRMEVLLFRVAVSWSQTLPRAMQYLRSAVELFRKICPYSEDFTKKYERFLQHPETLPEYLAIDKMKTHSHNYFE